MYPAARFGSGSGPIFLDQLHCSGSEQSLLDCPTFTDLGLHNCDHSMDAGVKCRGLYMSMHWCSRGKGRQSWPGCSGHGQTNFLLARLREFRVAGVWE